jgi:MFS transporter, OFA family, oxalate/formate antiporter
MVLNSMNQREDFYKKRWGYLILSIVIMLCLGTVYSWSIFRGYIEELYHIGTALSGLPYMASLAVYALSMCLIGKHIDKYNPRFIIIIGGILVGLGWILSASASNIYVLTITYGVVIGAGVGIAYGVPMTVIAKLFPEKKGLAVGLVLTGFGLSPLVTAPVASYLIINYGTRKSFWVLGISFGIIIPLLAYPFGHLYYREHHKLNKISGVQSSVNGITTKDMIKTKNFKILYLNFIIGTMIGLMLIGITNSVGVQLIKLSTKNVTLFIALFAAFNGSGRPAFGSLIDKFSTKKAMLISYILIIVAALCMILANEGSVFLYSVAFSIFWFNLGGWLSIAPTSTLAMFGTKYFSQNFGVIFTGYGIGAIMGVLVSGLLLDYFQNYDVVFYFVIMLSSIGIVASQKIMDSKLF